MEYYIVQVITSYQYHAITRRFWVSSNFIKLLEVLVVGMAVQDVLIFHQLTILLKPSRFQTLNNIVVSHYRYFVVLLLVRFYQLFYFLSPAPQHLRVLMNFLRRQQLQ